MRRIIIVLLSILFLTGCMLLGVRQSDLDAWVGIPVAALDLHSVFITMPVVRSYTSNGAIEIRNYTNEKDMLIPVGNTMMPKRITCNNIFYIHENCVVEYRPTGRCYTNASARPQGHWSRCSESHDRKLTY